MNWKLRESVQRGVKKKEKTDIAWRREQLYGYPHEILHSLTYLQFGAFEH
jgi:hypothetical protein